jgi:conjugal transfer pilus assembly protein TraB
VNPFIPIWNKLDPRVRRYLVVGLIIAGCLLLFTLLALMVPEPRKIGERKLVVKHLLTDADPRALGIEGLAAQLRDVTQKNESLGQRLNSLEAKERLNRSNESEHQRKQEDQESRETRAELNALKGQLEELRSGPSKTLGSPIIAREEEGLPGGTSKIHSASEGRSAGTLFDQGSLPQAPLGKSGMEIRLIRTGFDSATPKDKGPSSSATQGQPSGAVNTLNEEDERNTVFIPAGTLISGNLLNGLDAPTGKKARKEPFPVLARIQQEAILPNRFRADLRECFLIAAGYGDLSAERAYIRAETLSCVRNDGGVIEVPLDAYAVGEDGKLGLRGTVVTKQGQLMATSLLAGFAKGFSDAFSRVQVPVLMTGSAGSLGGSVPYQSSFNPMGMEGGGLKGIGYSMDRMAHYYMDLAENLFPIVEIDATRQIEFVVQRGTALKLFNPKDVNRAQKSPTRPY